MALPPPPSPITRLDLRQLYRALLRAHAAAPAAAAVPPAAATLAAYRAALYVGGGTHALAAVAWLTGETGSEGRGVMLGLRLLRSAHAVTNWLPFRAGLFGV